MEVDPSKKRVMIEPRWGCHVRGSTCAKPRKKAIKWAPQKLNTFPWYALFFLLPLFSLSRPPPLLFIESIFPCSLTGPRFFSPLSLSLSPSPLLLAALLLMLLLSDWFGLPLFVVRYSSSSAHFCVRMRKGCGSE